MANVTYDDLEDSLVPNDLTNNNFITEEELEDLLQAELTDDEDNSSMSPSVLSCTRLNSRIASPNIKGLGHDSDDASDFVEPKKKASSLPRQVFLITYSQADVVKVNDRKKFAEFVCAEFNREDDVVEKWVVSAEIHRQGGFHYHMAIKLRKQRR